MCCRRHDERVQGCLLADGASHLEPQMSALHFQTLAGPWLAVLWIIVLRCPVAPTYLTGCGCRNELSVCCPGHLHAGQRLCPEVSLLS